MNKAEKYLKTKPIVKRGDKWHSLNKEQLIYLLTDFAEKYGEEKLQAGYQIGLAEGEAKAEKENAELKDKIKKLEFMIENGLGWKDMENDITMPNEI